MSKFYVTLYTGLMHNHLLKTCVTCRGPSAPARGLWDLGELCLLLKGTVLSLTLLLVWCLR